MSRPFVMFALLTVAISSAQERLLVPLDQPMSFASESWNQLKIEDGRLAIRGEGLTAKGWCGIRLSETIDLGDALELSPALAVRVGPTNKMHSLRLILKDKAGREADYDFLLPQPTGAQAVILPREGASIGTPNATGNGSGPDYGQIIQWQFAGSYLDELPVDVTVEQILLLPPTPEMIAERQARAEAEAEQRRREAEELRAKYGQRTDNSPTIEHISLVAPDVVDLTIAAGHVVPGKLEPYLEQPGDEKLDREGPNKNGRQLILRRDGREIGWLIGPNRDQLVYYEQLVGDPLLLDLADDVAQFQVTSADGTSLTPTAVHRKSQPTDWAQPSRGFAMRHDLYLKLPQPLKAGQTYTVAVGDLNVQQPTIELAFDPLKVRSHAVHVNQIGYRPDDQPKRSFLSCWLGNGGALSYPDGLAFHVVDQATGNSVFDGQVELAVAATAEEKMWRKDNFSKTDVCRMDFGAVQTPGRYRVAVDGVGCSYPFEIGPDVWERAFVTQMKGLYNNRSGIELGPPYTEFRKPRDFHPADGAKVYQSTHSDIDEGNEWELAKHATEELVPDAWGGYHDAGDWNPRRITHLRTTMAQLELLEMFPDYFGKLDWNIPRTIKGPAILDEAIFELDCFRRLQKPDGGMPFGIETASDPIDGEVSWLQSMPAYVYAPDLGSSFYYAGAALKAAKLLEPTDPDLARTYHDSARRAFEWGEQDWQARKTAGTLDQLPWRISDWRNLAALILYVQTGDKHWHELFLEDTLLTQKNVWISQWGKHIQRDAAFEYARLPKNLADKEIQANAVQALHQHASASVYYAKGNAFNVTTPDHARPMFGGFYTGPDAIELCRVHYLQPSGTWLEGAVQACQFGGGGNPNNLVYTTGLGANPVQHPLHLDSRRTGQPAPEGLTTFGNADFIGYNQTWVTWPITWHLGKLCEPSAWDWPINEAYWDIFLFVGQNEFTIDTWAPNVYVWGYLAARP